MSSEEEVLFSDDEGESSCQLSDDEGNDFNQGLSDESEIEDDESDVDNADQELIIGTKYEHKNKIIIPRLK